MSQQASVAYGTEAGDYNALSSVWTGTDAELLTEMLGFYPVIDAEPILDATYNTGRMWRGTGITPVSMDIDPQYEPDIVADNRVMDGVLGDSYAVVVYDPPHVGPQGRDKSSKRFDVDFGATMACGKEHGWSLSYLYPPFLEQAKRVLAAGRHPVRQDYRHREQPPATVGTLRLHGDGRSCRFRGV